MCNETFKKTLSLLSAMQENGYVPPGCLSPAEAVFAMGQRVQEQCHAPGDLTDYFSALSDNLKSAFQRGIDVTKTQLALTL